MNLVDEVWENRPQLEVNPVNVHPLEFSGRSVADKLKDLRERMKEEEARAIVIMTLDEVSFSVLTSHVVLMLENLSSILMFLTGLDLFIYFFNVLDCFCIEILHLIVFVQVARLYNVRGNDVSCCPVVHSFAIVTSFSAFFYVDKRKLSSEVSLAATFFFFYKYPNLF